MEVVENKVLYKIVCGFYKFLNKAGKNISNGAEKLRFIRYKIEFGERDDDIYIVTFPKSGTTLTQMILYQLTTDGNIEFDHIYDVSPWLHNYAYKNVPLKDLPSPRLIKTHDPYNEFDKGIKGRFIFVYRDGRDVAVSLYHQRKNYGHPDLSFDKFMEGFLKLNDYNYFIYNKDWFKNTNKFPVLYLNYSDLINNLDSCLEKIIAFCKLDKSKIDFNRVKERCSFEFMKKNEQKFGDQPPPPPIFVFDQFIRKGKSGEGENYFSDDQKSLFQTYHLKFLEKFEKHYFGVK